MPRFTADEKQVTPVPLITQGYFFNDTATTEIYTVRQLTGRLDMRTIGVLPKSVLILECLGMILLALALLSLNHYLTLPAPFNTPLAGVLMVFLGVVLILPAAVAMMWRIAQLLAPQLMKRPPDISSRSDREKHNESDH